MTFISVFLLASERLGSSSRMRRSCDSRNRRKLMPRSCEGKVKKRAGIRAVTCGSSQPKPKWYNVSSASSAHICRTSETLLYMGENARDRTKRTKQVKRYTTLHSESIWQNTRQFSLRCLALKQSYWWWMRRC